MTGLLAGLFEFPTSTNVPKATSPEASKKLSNELLSHLLLPAVLPLNSRSKNPDNLRFTRLQPVGDVVHVFSHIKKTYRAQWVVLEGGETPPSLRNKPDSVEKSTTGKLPSKSNLAVGAKWTKLEDVSSAKYVICS